MSSIKNVALLGADGTLGRPLLAALLAHNFHVTVLKRQSSTSPPTHSPEIRLPDDFPVPALVDALRGQDAVITTINAKLVDVQKRLADASVLAGVKRFIPADFGSVDSSSSLTQTLVPLYASKTDVRNYLVSLAAAHPAFSWTSLVCGHFFDWTLDFLHIYPHTRTADMLDDGEVKWSASTLAQVSEATARLLEREEVARNRMVYVQSFLVTQREVIEAFERATGGGRWEVRRVDSAEYRRERKMRADEGDAAAVEDLVWMLGALDANWEGKEGFVNGELGLEMGSLEGAVRAALEGAGR